jgi:HSF-type DNA-binding/Conserved hypothetical protein (Lin0512_fam)
VSLISLQLNSVQVSRTIPECAGFEVLVVSDKRQYPYREFLTMQRGQIGSASYTPATTTTAQTRTEQQKMDERTAEIAATLMDVASFTKGTPLLQLPVTRPNANIRKDPSHSASNPTNHLTTTRDPPSFTTAFSTIGIGIDGDATEAARKAVRDALERGMQLNSLPKGRNHQIHIQLGVPSNQETTDQPVHVDTSRLALLLPSDIPLQQPIQVQVGGLLVPSRLTGLFPEVACATYVVVACLSVQEANHVQQQQGSAAVGSPTSVTTSPALATIGQVAAHPQQRKQVVPNDNIHQQATAAAVSAFSSHGFHEHSNLPRVPTTWEEVEQSQEEQNPPKFHHQVPHPVNASESKLIPSRTNSMEMLARISTAMIGNHQREQQHYPDATMAYSNGERDEDNEDDDDKKGIRYNYKKLPPGKTPKHNKRLFVQHSYRDYSHEVPMSDELDLMAPNAPLRTANAAFPLKLHEILSQIELDGHDNIIGWLPHGRSFKIHKQKEFVDIILPMYFVMTKKSSFLRQLNLYGFNRLSGIGPDQGSYYHQKFLRGLKFLSRRMQRQKVNGNGIRAAGNPDDEPVLSRFPICPPVQVAMREQKNNSSNRQQDLKLRCKTKNSSDQGRNKGKDKTSIVEGFMVAARGRAGPNATPCSSGKEVAVTATDTSQEHDVDPNFRGKTCLQASFPLKLQRVLDKLEAEENTEVLSWLPHGRAFIVHEADRFVNEVLPVYFNQTKYSSFQRQCHMYHFTRITHGRDKGAFHNPNFQRGRPELSMTIQRTRVNGKGTRRPGNPHKEPDLYALPPLPVIEPGTPIEIPLDLPAGAMQHYGLAAGDGNTSGSASGEED